MDNDTAKGRALKAVALECRVRRRFETEIKMTEGEIFQVLWILGGFALPFFPFATLIYLSLLVAALFVPASWFGL